MAAAADPAALPLVLPLPSLWVTPPKPVVAQPFQSTTGYNTPSLLPPSPSQWAPPTEEAMACSEDVHFPSPYFPSPHRVAFKRKGPPRSGGVALAVQVALRNRSLPNMRGPSSRRRPLAPQGATAGGGVCAEHTWPSPGLAIIDSLPHLRLRRRRGVIRPRHDPCPRHKATASPSCRRCASRAGDPLWLDT